MRDGWRGALERLAGAGSGIEVERDAPLARWSSVRVGGAAEALVRPKTVEGLLSVLRFAREEGAPVSILGGGANTLIGDLGVPGITLKLPSHALGESPGSTGGTSEARGHEVGVAADAEPDAPVEVELPAGAAIVKVVNKMRALERVGVEFLAGIPGTLGGAVTMNAGTKMGECMTRVAALEVATTEGIGWVPVERLPHGYRHTELPAGGVVTRVRFRLPAGDLEASAKQMKADLDYRKRTQPLSQPNSGSVFTNPPGEHAGRLIEGVGLKGRRVGGAQISELHANWIVNLGGASAADVVALIEESRRRVRDRFGIELTPEVKRLGRF